MKKFFAAMIFLLMISAQASAMDLKINRNADWSIRLAEEPFTLKIEGYSRLDGNFSKGVAQFGNLYFHFDCKLFEEKNFEQAEKEASRFGGRDFKNTVPIYTFEGSTRIYPITSDDGREFFLLATETGGGGSMKVIGERGGKWVKYFDTQDVQKNNQMAWDFYLQNFYVDGDKIIFVYEKWEPKKICRLVYKWDEAAAWFGVEVIK